MKKILKFIFPMYSVFNKESLSLLRPLIDKLNLTLRLYLLTLAIPLAGSIINILFCGILGIESIHGFWGNFYHLWVSYYFTGYFCGIIAYKWQLFLFCIAFIFSLIEG
jgi:hypothetical protein